MHDDDDDDDDDDGDDGYDDKLNCCYGLAVFWWEVACHLYTSKLTLATV